MSKATPKRASLADVAALAGVSSQTVSRVVRGLSVVADPTRERVLAAVAELQYAPNLAARSLSQRRTNVIHVVNATPLFHGHARTFLSIVSSLAELGFHASIAEAPRDENPTLEQIVPLGVDGIILLGGHDGSPRLVEAVYRRVPVVFVGQRDGLPDEVSTVGIDQHRGGELAAQHLIECGYQRLLHICGPKDWIDARVRRDGFLAECERAGVGIDKVSAPSWDSSDGYQAAAQMPDPVDAIFASNDHLALGAMRWLAEHGRAVPDDVGVVGFDNAEGADNFWPPLTTLRQFHREIGRIAVEQLAKLIDGKPAEHTVITPELIVRESTKGQR